MAALTALFTAVTGKVPRFRADGGSAAENLALQNIQAGACACVLSQRVPELSQGRMSQRACRVLDACVSMRHRHARLYACAAGPPAHGPRVHARAAAALGAGEDRCARRRRPALPCAACQALVRHELSAFQPNFRLRGALSRAPSQPCGLSAD